METLAVYIPTIRWDPVNFPPRLQLKVAMDELKPIALLFDGIETIDLHRYGRHYFPSNILHEVDYLVEQKVLRNYRHDTDFAAAKGEELKHLNSLLRQDEGKAVTLLSQSLKQALEKGGSDDLLQKKALEMEVRNMDLTARYYAGTYREVRGMNAFPILRAPIQSIDQTASKAEIFQILNNSIPIPKPDTPWERIIEFRRESDSKAALLALRNWVNDLSRERLTTVEVVDRLEYLKNEYQRALDFHKIATGTGSLETTLTATAEAIESLAKFQVSTVVKGLFAIKHRKVALTQAEMEAPGREIAYIVRAEQAFGGLNS